MLNKIIVIFLCVLGLPVLASEKVSQIDEIVDLPISKLRAVESEGQVYFLSESGRFVITGQIYDVWSRKTLDTLGEMKALHETVDIAKLGLNVDELNTVSLGQGDDQVVIFTDPKCSYCHELMIDAKKLSGKYKFKFVVIPALGDESNILSKRLYCSKDESSKLNALFNNSISLLESNEKNCDFSRYDMTLMAAQLLGVKGVPFLVSPDGRINRGKPKDLEEWIKG